MASNATAQIRLPEHVFNDLTRFISEKYQKQLPNSLLIAQAFILEHQNHGKEFGLPAINKAIEDGINQNLF
jgi:hypothetical protein